ncbi:hypothetical protein AB1286_15560 [Trinickia sp. NRRL B-1857]|uniref:hypothetical protein n=1 Tax=Trinickia sp. NRRL B-1857 TaxID=3162879 RepID=UPI003D2C0CEB
MSTPLSTNEFQETDFSRLSVSPTAQWANLGGQFRGLPTPVYYSGSLFAFTRNFDNRLGMCQIDTTGTKGKWSTWGGTLTYSPAAALSQNGSIAVIARMQTGQIQISYINPFQGIYTPWVAISGAPTSTNFTGPVQLVQNTNARLEAFALDTNGNLWHAWETSVGSNPQWSSWSHLGSGFNASQIEFPVFLLQNSGRLQAVLIGNQPNMYQSTQYAGGGYDSWSPFTVVGTTVAPSPAPQFANGPAANFDSRLQNAAYAGYNANAGQGQNPLVYCAPPSFPQWGPINNITVDQYPISNAAPVMLSNNGTANLIWATPSGQVYLVAEALTASNFWSNNIQPVGVSDATFTGQMSGIVNNGNDGLFMLAADGSLAFINYQPQ